MSQVVRDGVIHAPRATAQGRLLWRSRAACIALAAVGAATVGLTAVARAEIIQIPAITFATRSNATVIGDANFGTLTNATGTFFAPVPFPVDGDRVCQFTLVHRDNDGDFGIRARLVKKKILVGQNPFDPPVVMAAVATGNAPASAGVQKKTDITIKQPIIDLAGAFYYVELTIPATTLEVLGVQIDVRPQC